MCHLKITLSAFVSAVAADQACDPEVTTGRINKRHLVPVLRHKAYVGGNLRRMSWEMRYFDMRRKMVLALGPYWKYFGFEPRILWRV
jgi:hypothetical protein